MKMTSPNCFLKTNTLKTFNTVFRAFSLSSQNHYKVSVLGAAGGIGQPLSLLLKQDPKITHLPLYDIANTPGIVADLSHIDTPAKVTGYIGPSHLQVCLTDADVVVISAGKPRKPGMKRDDLFKANACVVAELSKACAKYCPNAFICIITNPINSTVPICCDILKKFGIHDVSKIFGVTTLDVIRSKAFVAESKNLDVSKVDVHVVGGHAGITIVPLMSQSRPRIEEEAIKAITQRIQEAGTEVVRAKAGEGSATLSMAYAGARFVSSSLDALSGKEGVLECAFVRSDVTKAKYFSTPLVLGPNGIKTNLGLGPLSAYEQTLVQNCVPELQKSIKKGEDFAAKFN